MNCDINFLKAYQQRIEQLLNKRLYSASIPGRLLEAMRYACLNGGKRIRAALVYATGDYCDANPILLDDAAVALETMHAFSLIHDDLPSMDNDDLRRNLPTCHIAFDEATAILAGDALQTYAFETLSKTDAYAKQRLQMVACLAKASGAAGMAGGQWLDIDATDKTLSLDALTHLHRLKTGHLISAAVELAMLAGSTTTASTQALRTYAKAIGLGFQIWDDVLDATQSTDVLGKTADKDQAQHKSTFVTLLGLENAEKQAHKTIHTALTALNVLKPPPQQLQYLAQYMIERQH